MTMGIEGAKVSGGPSGHGYRATCPSAQYGAQVMELAKPEFKARMAVKLAVAGAFHTDFMSPVH